MGGWLAAEDELDSLHITPFLVDNEKKHRTIKCDGALQLLIHNFFLKIQPRSMKGVVPNSFHVVDL